MPQERSESVVDLYRNENEAGMVRRELRHGGIDKGEFKNYLATGAKEGRGEEETS